MAKKKNTGPFDNITRDLRRATRTVQRTASKVEKARQQETRKATRVKPSPQAKQAANAIGNIANQLGKTRPGSAGTRPASKPPLRKARRVGRTVVRKEQIDRNNRTRQARAQADQDQFRKALQATAPQARREIRAGYGSGTRKNPIEATIDDALHGGVTASKRGAGAPDRAGRQLARGMETTRRNTVRVRLASEKIAADTAAAEAKKKKAGRIKLKGPDPKKVPFGAALIRAGAVPVMGLAESFANAGKNLPGSAYNVAVNTPVSMVKTGVDLYRDPVGTAKRLPKEIAAPIVEAATHPKRFFEEDPAGFALTVIPAGRLTGLAAGKTLRVAGRQSLERPAATLAKDGYVTRVHRPASRDAVVNRVQTKHDRENPEPRAQVKRGRYSVRRSSQVERRVDETFDQSLHVRNAEAQAAGRDRQVREARKLGMPVHAMDADGRVIKGPDGKPARVSPSGYLFDSKRRAIKDADGKAVKLPEGARPVVRKGTVRRATRNGRQDLRGAHEQGVKAVMEKRSPGRLNDMLNREFGANITPAGRGRFQHTKGEEGYRYKTKKDADAVAAELMSRSPRAGLEPTVIHLRGNEYGVIPKAVAERAARHEKVATDRSGVARLLRTSGDLFSTAALSTNPRWLLGQATEAVLRTAVEGATPQLSTAVLHALSRGKFPEPVARKVAARMDEIKPGSGHDFISRVIDGGHLSGIASPAHRVGAPARTFEEAFEGSRGQGVAALLTAAGRAPGLKQARDGFRGYKHFTMDTLNGFVDRTTRSAIASKVIQRELLDKVGPVTRADIDRVAHRLAASPSTVARVGRSTDSGYGKYSKFDPGYRSQLRHWTRFLPWYVNALKYIGNLPRNHPAKTYLMTVVANRAQEEWLKNHRLDLKSTREDSLPGWLRGQYPMGDGSRLPLAKWTPWGVFPELTSDPGGQLLGFVGPQLANPYRALVDGVEWTGEPIGGRDGAGTGAKGAVALEALLESVVPGARQANQISGLGKRLRGKELDNSALDRLKKQLSPVNPIPPGNKKKPDPSEPDYLDITGYQKGRKKRKVKRTKADAKKDITDISAYVRP